MVKRPCVFLDRDGVVNEKPRAGEYITTWSDFHLIRSTVDWVRLFNSLDLLVIVVTNQRGIARGLMTVADLDQIHVRMLVELRSAGAHIDDVFYCPHEQGSCECRKPRPGLIEMACSKWNIDLDHSIMIGDSELDRALAENCGMPFVRVAEGRITGVTSFGPRVPSGSRPAFAVHANPARDQSPQPD